MADDLDGIGQRFGRGAFQDTPIGPEGPTNASSSRNVVDESKRSFCGTLETPFFYSFTNRDGVKKEEEEEDFLKKNREEKK